MNSGNENHDRNNGKERYKQWEEVSYENAWCMDVMGLAH